MVVKRTFKFKLYKSLKIRKLEYYLRIACSIYNHFIALQHRYYKFYGKNINESKMKSHLTKLCKMERFSSWKELNSTVRQDIIERIMRSYKSFFSNFKTNKKARPPRFCKFNKYKSITFKKAGWKIENNILCFTHNKDILAKFKFVKSREINGNIKIITVKRNNLGDYYLFVVCDVEVNEVLPKTGKVVGLDFGLKHFLTTNEGNIIKTKLFFKQMRSIIQSLNRKRSCKIGECKGERKSKGWLKANHKLKKAYEKLRNLRENEHYKLAYKLCSEYSIMFIEDLNIKAMQRLYGKKICDLAFTNFVKTLEYVAKKCGCIVHKIDRYYASSQICSQCGQLNPDVKDLKIRKWKCPHCGKEHDRDVNASINILMQGIKEMGLEYNTVY